MKDEKREKKRDVVSFDSRYNYIIIRITYYSKFESVKYPIDVPIETNWLYLKTKAQISLLNSVKARLQKIHPD